MANGDGGYIKQYRQRVISEQQQIQEKLSLGATPKQASAILIRDSIRGFNSDGRFSKNGWLSEFTRNDVRADIQVIR